MGFPLFPFQLLPVSVLKYFHAAVAEEEEDHHRRKINASQKPPAPVSSFDGLLCYFISYLPALERFLDFGLLLCSGLFP